ncbi:MAG: hypothetical protein ACJAT4_001206 [Granulosicoccus sp.]
MPAGIFSADVIPPNSSGGNGVLTRINRSVDEVEISNSNCFTGCEITIRDATSTANPKTVIGTLSDVIAILVAKYNVDPSLFLGLAQRGINLTQLEKLLDILGSPDDVLKMLNGLNAAQLWNDNLDDFVGDLFSTQNFRDDFVVLVNNTPLEVTSWGKAWKAVVKHVDLRKNSDFLENIKDFSNDLLTQLDIDLLKTKYTLKELFLESPDDVQNIWKALKDDPSYHWELVDSDGVTSGSRWEKWSQREFFKDVTQKGRDFETNLLAIIKTRTGVAYNALKNIVPDLDNRYLLSQVQFCLPDLSPPCNNKGEFFIADQIWVKYDTDGDIVDMVVVDSKLSQGTSYSPGQIIAKNNVGGDLNYKPGVVRMVDELGQNLPSNISQGDPININAFYKAYGDGNDTFVGVQ